MEKIPEIELLAAMILGYAVQWARGPKHLPNGLSWIAVAVLGAGLWFWMTPGAVSAFMTDWRRALVALVMFVLASQGAARGSADAKTAPKTDAL